MGIMKEKESDNACSIPFFTSWINYKGDVKACCGGLKEAMTGSWKNSQPQIHAMLRSSNTPAAVHFLDISRELEYVVDNARCTTALFGRLFSQ